jgi:hypothetical protein
MRLMVKEARNLEAEVHVLAPQHPTGLVLVHRVVEVKEIDGGKYMELTTEEGRKHVLSAHDRLLVVF